MSAKDEEMKVEGTAEENAQALEEEKQKQYF